MNLKTMNAYRDIYEQLVDEVSFLWMLRSIVVEQPHYTREDIYELEQRIEAQLDGLMTAVEDAWAVCLDALELEQPGEVFTATVIAFRSHDVAKIQIAVEVGLKNDQTIKAFVSALGWLPEKQVHPWIKKFLTSKDLDHKYLALAACSVRRENPGEHLNRILSRDDCKQHEKLYARALRLVGEFRRQDLSQALIEAMSSDIDSIKFWSSWSSVLLGNRKAAENLQVFIFKSGPYQLPAINIIFRVLPVEQARDLITKLVEDKTQMRAVVQATGILGDPHAVNWLISIMADPALARIAAEAVSLITGIDLEQYQLTDELAPSVAQQPNDDAADEDVSLDEDENLPWPDVKKISQVWMNLGANFVAGKRYFLGRLITPELLNDKIVSAYQRQRHAAAMELSLMSLPMPLQNTRAKIQERR